MGAWQNRLVKVGDIRDSLACETTPFVLHGRLYRLENVPKAKEFPLEIPLYRFHEDRIQVRDVQEDRVVSVVLQNHYFGSAFAWDGRVYVFAGDYGVDQPWWHIRRIVMTSSDDLVHWAEPVTVIESENGERLFNTAVCRGEKSFTICEISMSGQKRNCTLRPFLSRHGHATLNARLSLSKWKCVGEGAGFLGVLSQKKRDEKSRTSLVPARPG